MSHSKAWRITAPLRLVKKKAISAVSLVKNLCIGSLRRLFHRISLNEAASYKLKTFFYRRFGFLFKKTISYQIWQNAGADDRQFSSFMRLSVTIPLLGPDEVIYFPQNQYPDISIVIPVFQQADMPLQCLKSLSNAATDATYEVLLVVSVPDLESRRFLDRIQGVRVVPVEYGKTLPEMWNIGANMAVGKFVAFLAGGVLPLPGWLDEMTRTFRDHPEAGLVGSQILLQDGMIQEGGGAMNEAGTPRFMGCGCNSFHPAYSYLQEVDFCSIMSFMVPRDVFIQTGGISDNVGDDWLQAGVLLSVAVRLAERKVLYNPLSKAVVLSRYQENVWRQFKRKMVGQASFDRKPETISIDSAGKILVIDARTPTPDQDSGSQDIVSYFSIFHSLDFAITFIPATEFRFIEKYTPDLQRMGVRCLYPPFVRGIAEFLTSWGQEYDLVLLYRAYCAESYIDMVQRYCSCAKIIFDTVDLHFVRAQRQAVIEGSQELLKNAEKTKRLELSVIRKADCTIVLSTEEREILIKETAVPKEKIVVIPLIREIPGRKNSFSTRKNILFVGGFEHRPNVDAMIFFARDIWPQVRKKLPETVFYIVGSKPPDEILNLAEDDVIVTGYVPDISPYLNECRLSVAPLRYGAGLKGKLATSLSYGLPCVASSIAVEGSGLKPGEEILLADSPEEFAATIIRLYQDPSLWNMLSDRGLDFMKQHFSFAAGRQKIETLLRELCVLR